MILQGILATNKALGATFKTTWVDTRGLSLVGFQWSSTAGTSPVGALTVEESNDPVIPNEQRTNPADSTASTAQAINISASDRVTIDGTGLTIGGANNTIISVENPARFVRLVYTRTSGTAVAQCWTHGRDTAA